MSDPRNRAAVEAALRKVGGDDLAFTGATTIADDLGFDSLDEVELIIAIEERLGITMPADPIGALTVDALTARVETIAVAAA